MTQPDLFRRRLQIQHISSAPLEQPEDVVRWLVAVQSQDPAGAKWSVGQRVKNGTDALVEHAFASGRILRTHVLRPTWHYVTPEDIRWVVQVTAPHVHKLNAYQYRQLELTPAVCARAHTILSRALQGGRQLTRPELALELEQGGIVAEKVRLAYIMMQAELDGLICSGAMRGKQHTYGLLEERAPNARTLGRDEALAELTRRFFIGHAPATLKHLVWWSGLPVADAKKGLEMVRHQLGSEIVNGQTFWFGEAKPAPPRKDRPAAYLIPEYDESLVGSRELGVQDLPRRTKQWKDTFLRPMFIDGQRAGTWRRTIAKGSVILEINLLASLNPTQKKALKAAARRYGRFLDLPVSLA